MNSDNSLIYLILPHYTGLLQPCEVGINKSLKDRLRNQLPLGVVIVTEDLYLARKFLRLNVLMC